MKQKDKIDAFKASCRVYLNEKEALESYHSTNLGDRYMYEMMQDDVDFVEDVFERLEDECGTQAISFPTVSASISYRNKARKEMKKC